MIMNEGKLNFKFNEIGEVIKFDDDKFYRNYYMKLPQGKGVDFIYNDEKNLVFLEVKDCLGYEKENLDRIIINSNKTESFDVEIAKKVASTLSCLLGAYTRENSCSNAKILSSLCNNINLINIKNENKKIFVILLLEGEFNFKSKNKKMIMKSIQDSLKEKLKWLECKVSVIDLETNNKRFFEIDRIKERNC